MISYKKLWIYLIEQSISKPKLREMASLSTATMTKLNKNEPVSLTVLMRICLALDCDIGDVMEIVKAEECACND